MENTIADGEKRKRRTLQELNLIDNFLFTNVVGDPDYGEDFCRMLLEIIFHRKLGRIHINAQKAFTGIDTDRKGTCLDLFIEEFADDTCGERTDSKNVPDVVFDLEPNTYDNDPMVLPKRMRYYTSMVDVKAFPSGTKHRMLGKIYAIMFVTEDPFGMNSMVYTVKNKICEYPDMPYDDGCTIIYLNTKGSSRNVPEGLKELLKYMEHTGRETAVTDVLAKMQNIVEHIKAKEEVSRMHIDTLEREEWIREKAREEGIVQQRKETEREKARADAAEAQLAAYKEKYGEL